MHLTDEQRINIVVNHAFDGWHHVHGRKQIGTGVSFNVYADLATFDFNGLTKLVISAHVVRVRAEVAQSGPRMLKIFLNCREDLPDQWDKHHPDGYDLISMVHKLQSEINDMVLHAVAQKAHKPTE